MRSRNELLIWGAVTVASLGVHVAAFGGLARRPGDGSIVRKPRPPSLVEMQVAPPGPAPAAPEPVQPAPKLPPRGAVARPSRAVIPRTAPPPSAAPPPQAEAPADFTGVTLTNTGTGAGWASATGNGEAMRGPVGTAGAKVTGRRVDGAASGVERDPGPPVVGLGDLSRPPQSPDLAAALERFYPTEARKRGLAGKAVVRARVMPEGRIADVSLVSETSDGFGSACKQTLRGSQWTPPIDRSGQPVSTFIHYTCRFEVR